MILKKRLNNNAIVAVDEKGSERILIGCGLGFQKKEGSKIEEAKIEKTFALADSSLHEQLKELLEEIPIEHVELANDILSYARIYVNSKVNDNALIALCDHIYMAVERKKQGIDVRNVLLWDIRRYYPAEYDVGLYALRCVKERFSVQLEEDEAGFIALHIVNAQSNLKSKTTQDITIVIQEIETIVRMTFKIKLDADSVYYHRFITHLRFFAERLFSGKAYTDQDVAGLADVIKKQYSQPYQCGLKIASFIEEKYHYHLCEEEILYLSIHIARIVQVLPK